MKQRATFSYIHIIHEIEFQKCDIKLHSTTYFFRETEFQKNVISKYVLHRQYFFRETDFQNNNTISDKEGQKVDENFEITPKSTYEENETSTATVKFAEKSAKSAAASNLIFS